jgi:hypothetical protein
MGNEKRHVNNVGVELATKFQAAAKEIIHTDSKEFKFGFDNAVIIIARNLADQLHRACQEHGVLSDQASQIVAAINSLPAVQFSKKKV